MFSLFIRYHYKYIRIIKTFFVNHLPDSCFPLFVPNPTSCCRMKCESEHLPSLNQWSCSSPDYPGSSDIQLDAADNETSRFTVTPVSSRTEFSQSEDEGNTDLFTGSILNSEMRQRRPSRSILQSPERTRLSREKSVVWKDNLVEYRYIDGNPVDRGLVNWGSVCYAVLLIVTSYVVYCLLHSVGIKPRGLR